MCKELCEQSEDGEMQSCQDCGRLICFDVETGDDIIRPAFVTSSGDLYCDVCGMRNERAEERQIEEEYEPDYYDEEWPV